MSTPLARLQRGAQRVWLHDRLNAPSATPPAPSRPSAPAPPAPLAPGAPGAPAAGASPPPFRLMGAPPPAPAPSPTSSSPATAGGTTRRNFWRADDAAQYLRFWRNDPAACRELRLALQRLEPSTWVFAHTDDRVIQSLAGAIAQGLVIVSESALPPPPAALPGVPAPPAAPALPLAMTVAPIKPPLPPLLPVLEEVQIEGAEVLPEIMQSLEQIDITLAEIKVAPVSLAPTPSKIPDIEAAMSAASGAVTKTLDEL